MLMTSCESESEAFGSRKSSFGADFGRSPVASLVSSERRYASLKHLVLAVHATPGLSEVMPDRYECIRCTSGLFGIDVNKIIVRSASRNMDLLWESYLSERR